MLKRGLAITQIFILLSSVIAFNFLLNINFVSAQTEIQPPTLTYTPTKGGSVGPSGYSVIKDIATKNLEGESLLFEETSKIQIQKDGSAILTDGVKTGVLSKEGVKQAIKDGAIKVPETGSKSGDWLLEKGWVDTAGTANFVGHIADGLFWSMAVVAAIKFIGGFVDTEGKVTSALSSAAFGGIMAGEMTYGLVKSGGWLSPESGEILGMTPKQFSIGAGLLVAAIIFYNSYKKTETETVTFTCNTWDAPTGGSYCEKCNEQSLPCSEYQCRSLGQACQLVNPGTDEAKCVWVNKNDVAFPTITPWDDALSDGYKYSPDNTINPPDSGVKIVKSAGECVGAFEPFSFGIILNEPAKCKIDYLRKSTFDEMNYFFGGSSTLKYNHTQVMSLPGAGSEENLTLDNNGNYELFVRCQDANGNYNKGNFVFKYCVEKGPDTTAPLIVTTNLLNGMPVSYNQESIDLEVYINEPAECKWSHSDQQYDNMEEKMKCSSNIFEMNAQMLYKCTTTLTGIKNEQNNDFYFRCKDQPTKPEADRNTNAESYKFTLIGTQPLIIDKVGPNETVRDSTENVKVTLTATTNAGYKEGLATCYYSETGNDDDYIEFRYTNSYTHSQDLYLSEGDYGYYIKCVDLGGNSDVKTTYFEVESDSEAPIVVRTFYEESYLKLITDEEAKCVYDTVNCNYLFDDGIAMKTINDLNHFTDWNTQTSLYVKCKDEYENQPAPNECNIIVRPIRNY